MALAAIGVVAILWAIGFDFAGAKRTALGTAENAAESFTGGEHRS